MKICYFGDYVVDSNRTRVITSGLEILGHTIVHCHTSKKKIGAYVDLFKQHRKIGNYDVLIVGFGDSRIMIILAKFLSRKIVVWEPLFSIYEAWIHDRKLAPPKSLKARYYFFLDWIGVRFADKIILDTQSNIDYYVKTFHTLPKKFIRAFIGADTRIFFPIKRTELREKFQVEFHGKYIPVQGVEYIVRAAEILKNELIQFTLIGNGQEALRIWALVKELKLKNITIIDKVPFSDIPKYISNADVCIGLVGSVDRVESAIPNKLYEAAAMKRVSINANTVALRELFTDGKDVVACNKGDAKDLAEKILYLSKHRGICSELGERAYETFIKNGTPRVVAENLIRDLNSALQ